MLTFCYTFFILLASKFHDYGSIRVNQVNNIIHVPTPHHVTISFHSRLWFLASYLPTFVHDVTRFTL